MLNTTGLAAAPYPLAGEEPDGPGAFLALAKKLVDITDPVPTIADLPATGNWTGRMKRVQSLPGVWVEWTGAAWQISSGTLTFADPAASVAFYGVPAQAALLKVGAQAYITSLRQFKFWTGTVWSFLSQLVPVVPSGVTVTSGAATIGVNGTITFANAVNPKLLGIFDTTLADIFDIDLKLNGAGASTVQFQLMNGSTPDTAANYASSFSQITAGGIVGANTNTGSGIIHNVSSALQALGQMRIHDPNIVSISRMKASISTPTTSTATTRTESEVQHNVSAAYDGLYISSAGAINGTAQILAHAK